MEGLGSGAVALGLTIHEVGPPTRSLSTSSQDETHLSGDSPFDIELLGNLVVRAWAPKFDGLAQAMGDQLYRRLMPDWQAAARVVVARAAGLGWDDGVELELVDAISGLRFGRAQVSLLVAELTGRPVGCIAIEAAEGWLGELATDPDEPDAVAVGRALIGSALTRMRAAGASVACFQTWSGSIDPQVNALLREIQATLLPPVQYFRSLSASGSGLPSAPTGSDRAVVREYTVSDKVPVLALSLRSWAPVFETMSAILGPELSILLHGDDWREHQSQAVGATVDSPDKSVLVAEVDGVVAGFVAIGCLDKPLKLGELDMLAVDPQFQRRGLGLVLTNAGFDAMSKHGLEIAVIEPGADEGHAPARRTYEAAGCTALRVDRYFAVL